jgi:DsbC/DsbD-like thiol-disulfide interchange protein
MQIKVLLFSIGACLAIGAVCADGAIAQVLPSGHVQAVLLADDHAALDKPFWLGLSLTPEHGWHTYWKNPGDAGMPTRISWDLPPGWSAGDIDWPVPSRIPVGPLANYGYEGPVLLTSQVFPPRDWQGQPVRVVAHAHWLVCKDQCVPESADLVVALPAPAQPQVHARFVTARQSVPEAGRFTRAEAHRVSGRLVLTLSPATSGQFFPDHEELVEPGDAPDVRLAGAQVQWSAPLGEYGKSVAVPSVVRGVWVPKAGRASLVEAQLN